VIAKHLNGANVDAQERHRVDVRIQVDNDLVHFSLNIRDRPVGKRVGEPAVTRAGALRPTVAAALVRLAVAQASPGIIRQGIYDPFCGSGTILAEATAIGLPVFGSDIDPEAVTITRQRLAQLGRAGGGKPTSAEDWTHRVFTNDVLKAAFPARVLAKAIVGNMPWGKQIKLERRTELFDATAKFITPAIAAGGVAVLLTTQETQLAARLRKHIKNVHCETVKIGLLGQSPAIVLVTK
jgi:tRNA G10  N-methylase Trm11